jgi:hypothetical protein
VAIKQCLNEKILNDERTLTNRVVNILEGAPIQNECYKLDNSEDPNMKSFKIVKNLKNKISVKLFSCLMDQETKTNLADVFRVFSYFFKNKLVS